MMGIKDLVIIVLFFGGLASIFILIMWVFSKGAKWNTLKQEFPDRPYAQSLYTLKNVVRRVGTMNLAGNGGMKIRFTDQGLRVTSRSFFFNPIMIPYNKISIVKIYQLRGTAYIYLKVNHEVDFDIFVPSKIRNMIEKYIGSLDGYEIEQKHVELDIGIG